MRKKGGICCAAVFNSSRLNLVSHLPPPPRYVQQLADMHESAGNFMEAGLTILMQANLLSFDSIPEKVCDTFSCLILRIMRSSSIWGSWGNHWNRHGSLLPDFYYIYWWLMPSIMFTMLWLFCNIQSFSCLFSPLPTTPVNKTRPLYWRKSSPYSVRRGII